MIIYKATNLINNKCYIGQTKHTLDKRIIEHTKYDLNDNYYFHNALKKYRIENFKWTILEICFNQEELNEKEKWYIKHFNSFGKNGYNLNEGGKGNSGYIASEETKKKMSESGKGRIFSEETKRKISESHKGIKHTEESKIKISESRKGHTTSEETKKKMSISHQGKNHPLWGKHHSDKTKDKMRESHSKKNKMLNG